MFKELDYNTPIEMWIDFKKGVKFILHYHDNIFNVSGIEPRDKIVYVHFQGFPVKIYPTGKSAEGPINSIWLEKV